MTTAIDELITAIAGLRRDLEDHKVATASMFKPGPVVERDHEKGVRVDFAPEGAEVPDKSSWIQPSEASGVFRDLPRKGEQLYVLSPYGDPQQGTAIPFGHIPDGDDEDKKNPSPDAETSTLFKRDGCVIQVKDGKVTWSAKEMTFKVGKSTVHMTEKATTIEVDGKKYLLDGDGHTLTGGKVTHEKRNIGASHVHGGVMSGPGKTANPDE